MKLKGLKMEREKERKRETKQTDVVLRERVYGMIRYGIVYPR